MDQRRKLATFAGTAQANVSLPMRLSAWAALARRPLLPRKNRSCKPLEVRQLRARQRKHNVSVDGFVVVDGDVSETNRTAQPTRQIVIDKTYSCQPNKRLALRRQYGLS